MTSELSTPVQHYDAPPSKPPGNGLAVASLILGICGIVVGVLPLVGLILTFVPTALAIVLGICGIVRSNRVLVGKGLAVTGLVLGSVTLVLYLVGYGTFW